MKSLGKYKKTAELFLKDVELKLLRGELKIVDDTVTFKEFFLRYLEYSKFNKSKKTMKSELSRWKRLRSIFEEKGIVKLKDITSQLMEEFKGKVLQKSSRGTFNHHLALLNAMLNKAFKWRCLNEN